MTLRDDILGLFDLRDPGHFWPYLAEHPALCAEPALRVVQAIVADLPDEPPYDFARRMAAGLGRCSRVGLDRARADWATGTDYLTPAELDETLESTRAAQRRWTQTEEPAAVEEAVAGLLAMAEHPAAGDVLHDFRLGLLNDAALLLMNRHNSIGGDPGDLRRARDLLQRAVDASPPHWDASLYHSNIATACLLHAEATGNEEMRAAGMTAIEAACLAAPPGSATLENRITTLGRLGKLGYAATHDTGRLDELIAVLERIPGATSGGDAPPSLNGLLEIGEALLRRFEIVSAPEDAERAEAALRAAVALRGTPADRGNHAIAVRAMYSATGDPAYLDEAITISTAMTAELGPDHPWLPPTWHNLGVSLMFRYGARDDPADLTAAIEALERAVALTDEDSPLALRLNALADALARRYRRDADIDDLNRSDELVGRAAALAPENSPQRLYSETLLLRSSMERIEKTGDMRGLEAAYERSGRLLRRVPAFSALAEGALVARYKAAILLHGRPGHEWRLTDALEAAERIYVNTIPGSERHQAALIGYVICLMYADGGRRRDLDLAVQLLLDAEADPRLERLYAKAVQLRYQRYGDNTDFSTALARHTEAGQSAVGEGDRRAALAGAGSLHHSRYRRTGDPASLDRTITALSAALDGELPERNIDRRETLAEALRDRHRLSGRPEDLERGVAAYRECAAASSGGSVLHRLNLLRDWSEWAAERGAWPEVLEVGAFARREAADLEGLEAGPVRDRWLAVLQETIANTALALVRLGRPEEAAVALESGRAVALSEALELLRADLDLLRETGHAELADRFTTLLTRRSSLMTAEGSPLRDQLSALSDRVIGMRDDRPAALRAVRAELAATAAAMRQVGGHEDFLRPPAFADLVAAARAQPLVYLAATGAAGMAVVVRPDGTCAALALDGLTTGAIRTWTARLAAAFTGPDPTARRRAIEEIAGWLGEVVMGPLLAEVASYRAVTLVPGGLLGTLPLHAAQRGRRSVLDELACSYAPSARALSEPPTPDGRPRGMLAVQEPAPVSAAPLPGAAGEIAAARAVLPDGPTLRGEAATVAAVLAEWGRWPVLHFACHGIVNASDPRGSRLVMAFDEPLDLRGIARSALPGVRLVALSACETALSGDQVPDELLSLAAGFLQAGATGVVGSLWPVPDVPTALLFARFYQLWLTGGHAPAEALRAAQVWLRDATNAEKSRLFPGVYPPAGDSVLWQQARVHTGPENWAGFVLTGR